MEILCSVFLFAFVVSACEQQVPFTPVTRPAPTPAPSAPIVQSTPATNATTTPLGATAPSDAASSTPLQFDGKHAYDEYLLAQMKIGIRPAGSKADRATGDYIIEQLKKTGWEVETQEFQFRGVPIRNVIGKFGAGQGPLLVLGAHYDTRPRANMDQQNPSAPVPGANDGASGVAVLLELARTLDKAKLKNQVWLAFFDAEDNGDLSTCDLLAAGGTDTTSCDTTTWDWSIGATHVADNLPSTPEAVIVLDMIGDANQNIYYERNSDKDFQTTLWNIAAQLGYRQWFIPEIRWSMTDDHTPFLQRKIRAVDMIDFDYPPWHTTQDTADKVSAESLERVGRVMQTWLENK